MKQINVSDLYRQKAPGNEAHAAVNPLQNSIMADQDKAYREEFKTYFFSYLKDNSKSVYITNSSQAKQSDNRDYTLRIRREDLTLILGKRNVVWTYCFESGKVMFNGQDSGFNLFYNEISKIYADQTHKKVEYFTDKKSCEFGTGGEF